MTYFFDGTKNGFLTAFTKAFLDEDAILTSRQTQLLLGSSPITVPTYESLAQRTEERLLSFDGYCMHDLDRLLRCGEENNEQVAFRYLRKLALTKRPIGNRLADEDVFAAVTLLKKVGLEIHRLHGFVRFMETASGALYAPLSPDNDVVDLLLPHFKARLPHYPFVLHDVIRKKASVYDGKNSFNAYLPHADVILSANEQAWQSLWKDYYHAVNIPSRERLKQMKNYMPARYWQHMPEKQ